MNLHLCAHHLWIRNARHACRILCENFHDSLLQKNKATYTHVHYTHSHSVRLFCDAFNARNLSFLQNK